MHSYQHVLDGFAAWLTEAELEAVSIKPGFSKSIPDEPMYLVVMPDRTGVRGGWVTDSGSGVIIGVIDTGINSRATTKLSAPDPTVRDKNKSRIEYKFSKL